MFDEIFNTANQESKGTTILSKTNILNALAKQCTQEFIDFISSSKDDEVLKEKVTKSATDYAVLEDLVKPFVLATDTTQLMEPIGSVPNQSDDDDNNNNTSDVMRMLKSQASSKSHNRKKLIDSGGFGYYRAYVQAAIAEALLRKAYNIPKASKGFSGTTRTSILYTEEELNVLQKDQRKLRAAIRNVQSKKSIELKKLPKGETNERLEQIKQAEEQLKGIRIAVEPLPSFKSTVNNLIDGVDELDKLKKDDLLALIKNIQEAAN